MSGVNSMSVGHLSAAKKLAVTPRFMRLNNITSYLSFSKSYINALIKAGKFPAGINIGSNLRNSGKVIVWEKKVIDEWADEIIYSEVGGYDKS
jgi:predicted DNA-binding transcriptional regulator AlpA